jgi:hypothetical protein
MHEKYIAKKLRDIENEICAAVGAANLTGIMQGKCTDNVIKWRDDCTNNVQKIVKQIIKKLNH